MPDLRQPLVATKCQAPEINSPPALILAPSVSKKVSIIVPMPLMEWGTISSLLHKQINGRLLWIANHELCSSQPPVAHSARTTTLRQ